MRNFYFNSILFVAALSILEIGCSESEEAPDAGATTAVDAQAAQPDSGSTVSGEMDAGEEPPACSAITGEGCSDGKYCFYVSELIGTQCREQADPPKENGEECSRSLQDCRAGFYCVLFQGESGNSKCRKVCDRGSHEDCKDLTGNPDGYECAQSINRDLNLGVCSPVVPECLPFNDQCENGKYCEYSGGKIRCLDEGTGQRGGPCDIRGRCQRGSICITVDGDASCYEPCNPESPSCSDASKSCVRQNSLSGSPLVFGICD